MFVFGRRCERHALGAVWMGFLLWAHFYPQLKRQGRRSRRSRAGYSGNEAPRLRMRNGMRSLADRKALGEGDEGFGRLWARRELWPHFCENAEESPTSHVDEQ